MPHFQYVDLKQSWDRTGVACGPATLERRPEEEMTPPRPVGAGFFPERGLVICGYEQDCYHARMSILGPFPGQSCAQGSYMRSRKPPASKGSRRAQRKSNQPGNRLQGGARKKGSFNMQPQNRSQPNILPFGFPNHRHLLHNENDNNNNKKSIGNVVRELRKSHTPARSSYCKIKIK